MVTDVITCPSLSAIIRSGSHRFTGIFSPGVKRLCELASYSCLGTKLSPFFPLVSADVCTQSNLYVSISKGRLKKRPIAEEFSSQAQIMRTRTPLGISVIRVPPTGFLFCSQFRIGQ